MTAQRGFCCAGGAPEARSTANFDDHLSRSSVIADTADGGAMVGPLSRWRGSPPSLAGTQPVIETAGSP
jgi:hypothetical protein